MELALTRDMIIAVLWFMIGFGAGLFILSLWKYIIIGVVVAIIAPIILAVLGLNIPLTPETVVDALLRGVDMLADVLSRNRYAMYGFIVGAALGFIVAILRLQRSVKNSR
jgi:hypothetical protein